MDWNNPKSVETMISRLEREIAEIQEATYPQDDKDRVLYASRLERKRDDVVRSTVLQLHTAIEDLLTTLILYCLLEITDPKLKHRLRSNKAKALRELLQGNRSIGFAMKLNLAVGLGLINVRLQEQLMDMNSLRNKCAHNWLLKAPVRHGKRPKQLKPPLLQYRNRDLHKVAVLTEFIDEFGAIYVRLYGRWVGWDDE